MENEFLISLFKIGVDNNATDIHIRKDNYPLFRINGKLKVLSDITDILYEDNIKHILNEILSKNQIEKLIMNKVFDTSILLEDIGSFRVHIYFQRCEISLAIRILSNRKIKLKKLIFCSVIEDFIKFGKGLFLITGPTGSGKSTTLASILEFINENEYSHIVTIEDPIEYFYKNKNSLISQKEIDLDINNYSEALVAALREDPDVIMLGELRDNKSISIALDAAETGHIVFSTLHTIGAVKTIDRIIRSFPTSDQDQIRNQLSNILYGVISQQLIPGFNSNMVLTTEAMIVNNNIRNLIRENKVHQINNSIQTGKNEGMYSMDLDIARLYKNNLISKENAYLYSMDKLLLDRYLN